MTAESLRLQRQAVEAQGRYIHLLRPALIVGAVVLAAGGILLALGRSKLKGEHFKPTRVARSVRRDAEVVKEHLT